MDYSQPIGQYHSVFAQTMSEIVTRLTKDEKGMAKEIIRFNINYAYSLFRFDKDINNQVTVATVKQELENLDLEDKEIQELIIMMVKYQSLAGIKPTQQYITNSLIYNSMKEKLQNQIQSNIPKKEE